eukprot:scaffold199560_cov17-Tisochrysis_lutea.AAC.1
MHESACVLLSPVLQVAAVTHESAQHSSGAGGAGFGGHGAALGGGVRDRELQEHLATSSYDHAKPPS